jgi:glycosyltransferase involved in cell wall biosynthesis
MLGSARERRHVLALTDSLGDAGAEHVAMQLLLDADPERFRRSLCVTRPPLSGYRDEMEANLERVAAAGVDVLRIDRWSRADLWSWSELVKYLRAERVDLIHAHKFGSNAWGSLIGRVVGVPVVIAHEQTWSFEGQPVRRLIDRHVVGRLADVVIAVSEADRRRMTEVVGIPPERIVLIPNGVPPIELVTGDGIRSSLGLSAEAPVLVQTTVLRAQKAIDVMLRALAMLRQSVPSVRLLVVGSGDQTELRGVAAQLGVEQAVSFLGHRDDVGAILAAADVGVLSSDFEGCPLSVLEYMAAGLPVVATAVGGLPQQVEDGETGFLVPRRDPAALASAIARVLADRPLARQMGERGRVRQHELYSSQTMATRVYELYDELLARAPRQTRRRSRRR